MASDNNDKSNEKVIQNYNKNLDNSGDHNLLSSSNIYEKYRLLEISDPYYQVLEIDDRLGYRPSLDVSEGRYLPIKLSFDSYIDYNLINSLIGDPKTDMGDSIGWFTSKFSGWISVKESEKTDYYSDFLPIDGFEYKDQTNLFDFMSNLKDYAEYDTVTRRYVIRLFPTFSNGKNYDEVQNANPKNPSNGYRDGIRLDYFNTSDEKMDENTTLSMETRFFSFKGNRDPDSQDSTSNLNLNYAYINNFSFDNSVKAIELRGTKIFDDKWIQVEQSNGNQEYIKDWTDFINEDGKILGEDKKIIDLLSPNQLYNIYVINGTGKNDNQVFLVILFLQ